MKDTKYTVNIEIKYSSFYGLISALTELIADIVLYKSTIEDGGMKISDKNQISSYIVDLPHCEEWS